MKDERTGGEDHYHKYASKGDEEPGFRNLNIRAGRGMSVWWVLLVMGASGLSASLSTQNNGTNSLDGGSQWKWFNQPTIFMWPCLCILLTVPSSRLCHWTECLPSPMKISLEDPYVRYPWKDFHAVWLHSEVDMLWAEKGWLLAHCSTE